MNPTLFPTDPVIDNRPDNPTGRGSQKLAYVLIIALGFVLLGMGAYARFVEKLSWLPEMTIAAGVAIAAPGLLSYLYRKFLLDDVKLELQQPAQ